MLLKEILKPILPPFIYSALAKTRRALLKLIDHKETRLVKGLKRDFDEICKNDANNEMTIREGLKLQIHPDSRVGFEHFCYRSSECVEEFDSFIMHSSKCRNLLDVGAMHGIFSLYFTLSGHGKKALAVDASPLAYSKLLYNIHKNRALNITPIECAISDELSHIEMHFEGEHAVASTYNRKGFTISVAALTGDYVCETHSFIPDAIKIDVEGHEVKVVKGLLNTINLHKPVIFLEIHPSRIIGMRSSIVDMLTIFRDAGYVAYDLRNQTIDYEKLLKLKFDVRLVLRSDSTIKSCTE